MAKENKSTTIFLLVIAGALLFLVGSLTGQVTFGSFGKTTSLNKCKLVSASNRHVIANSIIGNNVCKVEGYRTCVAAFFGSTQETLYPTTNTTDFGIQVTPYNIPVDCNDRTSYDPTREIKTICCNI